MILGFHDVEQHRSQNYLSTGHFDPATTPTNPVALGVMESCSRIPVKGDKFSRSYANDFNHLIQASIVARSNYGATLPGLEVSILPRYFV